VISTLAVVTGTMTEGENLRAFCSVHILSLIHLISNEARDKLRNFEGRSGFGSDDYYDRRPEEGGGQRSPGGSVSDLAGVVGSQASDFVRRFGDQASDDWSNLKSLGIAAIQKASNVVQDVSVGSCLWSRFSNLPNILFMLCSNGTRDTRIPFLVV
jgi:hypothetical protein